MRGRVNPRLLLAALLLVGSGCALEPPPRGFQAPPASPAGPGAPAVQAPPSATVPAGPPVLQPVRENNTFVIQEGVPRYKIGPGDVVEILLKRGVTEEKHTASVKASGIVPVAFLEVKVTGLTTEQAAEEIRRVLAPFYRQMAVEVLVREHNSKKVTVLGALGSGAGGLILPLKGRRTLLQLLAEAGGPSPMADLERVRVIRPEGPPVTVNLFRLLEEPIADAFVVDTDEVVFVPTRTPPAERKVFVLGEVRSPGAFALLPNMRLSQALALAGGTTDVAVLESARIVRGGLSNSQIVQADFRRVLEHGDRSQDLVVQADDVIVLPRSAIGNWNAYLAKIRPTMEFLMAPLQAFTQGLLLRELLRRE